tara:strand:- start:3122 stop:4423 length:1302 start_codon:yes stop_codon:yes gene_type:complete
MAGLLDIFGTGGSSTMGLLGMSPEDITRNRDDAQAQALYALAGRLFQGGNTGASIAQGLQQGQQAYKGAMQSGLQEQLQNVQLMDMLKKRREEELTKQQQLQAQQVLAKAYRPETYADTPLTDITGQQIAGPNQPQAAGGGLRSVTRELMGLGPAGMTALQTASGVEKALRPEGYTLGEGQIRYEIGADGKPVNVAEGQPKAKTTPAEIQGYNLAVGQGYSGSFLDYQTALKKAGVQNTIVNVAGKTFASEFSKGAGEAVNNAYAAAQGAVGTLGRIETLKPILEGGKLFSGTLGNSQVAGARLADALNIGGKDNSERLQNTSLAMQQLAGLELNAAEAMKGQGAITENERGLIARAAAGDLMKMTAKEVSTLLGGLEKTANYKISIHESNLKRLKQNPDLAAVAQYYELPTVATTPTVQNTGLPSGVTVKRK